jgi:hypothetical protein
MSAWLADPRRKAGAVVGLVFVVGVLAGIALDRVWRGQLPSPVTAAPLTVDALADSLRLDSGQRARVRQVVDSLDTEILRASTKGPEALRLTAQQAQQRLEDAVPADRRSDLQAWMQRHHARMMRLMGGGSMMGPGMQHGRSMMGPTSAGSGMMGGGMMQGMMRPAGPDSTAAQPGAASRDSE